jgi:hypothetical protein
VAQQAFNLLTSTGGGGVSTNSQIKDPTTNAYEPSLNGGKCGGRQYEIILTQSETMAMNGPISLKCTGHETANTSNNDPFAHIYLGAYPGFSPTITFQDGSTSTNYFSVNYFIDLSFGGNLTIIGGDRRGTSRSSLISIIGGSGTPPPYAVVTMNSGVCIRGFYAGTSSGDEGAVYLNGTKAVFIMNGGSIRDNHLYPPGTKQGAGVMVVGSTFIMKGGSISENTTGKGNNPAQIYAKSEKEAWWGPNIIGTIKNASGTPVVYVPCSDTPVTINSLPTDLPSVSGLTGIDMSGHGGPQQGSYTITQDLMVFR